MQALTTLGAALLVLTALAGSSGCRPLVTPRDAGAGGGGGTGGGSAATGGGDGGQDGDGGQAVARLANSPWPMYQHDPRHTGRSLALGPVRGAAPLLVAGTPALLPRTADGGPVGPPALQPKELCCHGVWAPLTIGTSGEILAGSVFRYDFDLLSDYFVGMGNPAGVGPSGMFHSFTPDGTPRFRFDNSLGTAALSAIESGAVVLENGTAIFGKDDGHVYALSPDGGLVWQFPTAGPSSAAVDVFDTADGPCTLDRAYHDASTCYLPDKTCQDNEQFVASPSLGPEGNLYVASIWANVWGAKTFLGPPPLTCLARSTLGARLPIWGKVYALDPRRGALLWTGNLSEDGIPRAVWSGPAVGRDGTVYVSTYTFHSGAGMYGTLFAFSPGGAKLWTYPAVPDAMTDKCLASSGATCALASGPMVGDDGTVYVGSYDSRTNPLHWDASAPLLAIRPDGRLKWSFSDYNNRAHTGYDSNGQPVSFGAREGGAASVIPETPALAPDGTVVFAAGNFVTETLCRSAPRLCRGFLVKVRDTGGAAQLVWVKSLPQPIGSAPAIDAAGNIYVGTSHRDDISDGLSGMPTQYPDGTVWAFDSEGNHLWHHTFSGGKLNKSFAIGEDGSLYVATQGRPYGVYRFRPQ